MGRRIKIELLLDQVLNRTFSPPAEPEPPPDSKLDWRLIAGDLAQTYPPRAMLSEVSGRAEMRCRITDDRRLDQCWALSETPEGYDFGTAAVRAASSLKVVRAGPPAAAGESRTYDATIVWTPGE